MLATGSSGGLVCLWDRRHPLIQLSVLTGGQAPVLDLAWSAFDSKHIFTCGGHRSRAKSSGSVKVWDINSTKGDHLSVEIENDVPTALKALPFGDAVLVGVGSSVMMLKTDNMRKAEQVAGFIQPKSDKAASSTEPGKKIIKVNQGMTAIHGAPPEGMDSSWRIMGYGSDDRTVSTWNYKVPTNLLEKRALGYSPTSSPHSAKGQRSPIFGPESTPTDEEMLPQLGPLPMPGEFGPVKRPSVGALEGLEQRLEQSLVRHAAALRELDGVIDASSYQLPYTDQTQTRHFVLATDVCVDIRCQPQETNQAPTHVTLRCKLNFNFVSANSNRERPVKLTWDAQWEGQYPYSLFDGPLAPGTMESLLEKVTIESIKESDSKVLTEAISSLIGMLRRMDAPLGGYEINTKDSAGAQTSAGEFNVPFPATCGVCWAPGGGLFHYHSLKNSAKLPLKRKKLRYSDYTRIIKLIKDQEDMKILLRDGDGRDELFDVAMECRVSAKIFRVMPDEIWTLTPNHWWVRLASEFSVPVIGKGCDAGEVCAMNAKSSASLGATENAEIWQLMGTIFGGEHACMSPWKDLPWVRDVIDGIIRQLFKAEDNMTIALIAELLYVHEKHAHEPETRPKHIVPESSADRSSEHLFSHAMHASPSFSSMAGLSHNSSNLQQDIIEEISDVNEILLQRSSMTWSPNESNPLLGGTPLQRRPPNNNPIRMTVSGSSYLSLPRGPKKNKNLLSQPLNTLFDEEEEEEDMDIPRVSSARAPPRQQLSSSGSHAHASSHSLGQTYKNASPKETAQSLMQRVRSFPGRLGVKTKPPWSSSGSSTEYYFSCFLHKNFSIFVLRKHVL